MSSSQSAFRQVAIETSRGVWSGGRGAARRGTAQGDWLRCICQYFVRTNHAAEIGRGRQCLILNVLFTRRYRWLASLRLVRYRAALSAAGLGKARLGAERRGAVVLLPSLTPPACSWEVITEASSPRCRKREHSIKWD